MIPDLTGKRVAILATDGFEQSELTYPQETLSGHGASVTVVAPEGGSIRGWQEGEWCDAVAVDRTLDDAAPEQFDALVLPGGVINPDHLRTNEGAIRFITAIAEAGKPVAAICHGPWLLAEAGLAKGRRLTSYGSIKTDMANAGGEWRDQSVVRDGNIITSRSPRDLPDFVEALAEALTETQGSAAA